MEKIPTLYVRDPDNPRRVTDEVTPGCEWVLAGEGRATRKYDGTCVLFDGDSRWWARREVKKGKAAPPNFIEVHHDPKTGKTQGWVPIEESSFAVWHEEAIDNQAKLNPEYVFEPGTYELVGPKVNGNPEGYGGHTLVRHGTYELAFDLGPTELVIACGHQGWEGVVWHHPDGRMAKLKVRDFAALASVASSEEAAS